MGSAVSACCSAEPPEKKEFITTPSGTGAGKGDEKKRASLEPGEIVSPRGTVKRISSSEVEAFQKRLENAITVTVLLADSTKLSCQLTLDLPKESLIISCDANVRVIQFSELKSILFGRDQLKRVETKANLVDDPDCAALHMISGNCIPIKFDNSADRAAFCELIKSLKSR